MFKFNKSVEEIILKAALYSAKIGVPLYFVGGMVRDALMEIELKDIDLLVEGSAIEFVKGFKDFFPDVEIKSLHPDFDTAKTVITGIDIDFASTREESYPSPGCLPVVKNVGCPIKEDLKRRDFTVNSIAARVFEKDGKLCYEIIDPFNGKEDIEEKTLKILHDKSYIDDPTRILRGLNFCLRFGFKFSKEDEKLIEKALLKPAREGLSVDRIKLTLNKLFSSPERSKEVYKAVCAKKLYKIWQDQALFKEDWAEKLQEAAEIFCCKTEEIFGNIMFYKTQLPETPDFKDNFEIYNFYKTMSNLEIALRYAILEEKQAEFYFKKLKDKKPILGGKDLIEMGFNQGKTIGEALSALQKEELNNLQKTFSKEEEKDFIFKNFNRAI